MDARATCCNSIYVSISQSRNIWLCGSFELLLVVVCKIHAVLCLCIIREFCVLTMKSYSSS